jgi:histidine triad (HIT) family protein
MAEYSSKTKEGNCIFCKIASGEIQPLGNAKIWETEKYLAWLSPFPNTEGFTVIIPKKHFGSDVLQMPEEELKEFVLETKKVSTLLMDSFKDVGRVGLIMEGMGIDHAHIKLFPMHGTEYLKKGEWKQIHSNIDTFFDKYEDVGYISSHDGLRADDAELKKLADKIKSKIK